MKSLRRMSIASLILGLFLFPSMAFAHPGHAEASFSGGFFHPLTGLDHLLAMVAVGLLAFQRGGRAVWALPLTFMGMMVAGGLVSLGQFELPAVEFMIMLSVVMLGAMVALQQKVPTTAATLLIGLFALFHGHAHLSEMGANQVAGLYSAGFLLSTGLLHALGLGLGFVLFRQSTQKRPQWVPRLGAAVSVMGLLMMAGVL